MLLTSQSWTNFVFQNNNNINYITKLVHEDSSKCCVLQHVMSDLSHNKFLVAYRRIILSIFHVCLMVEKLMLLKK